MRKPQRASGDKLDSDCTVVIDNPQSGWLVYGGICCASCGISREEDWISIGRRAHRAKLPAIYQIRNGAKIFEH